MAPLVIHSTIPRREDSPQGPILVILLGRVFSSKEAQEEATRVTDARSRFALTGSGHLWPTYVAMHDVEEDIYGNTGVCTLRAAFTALDRRLQGVMQKADLVRRLPATSTT